MLEIFVAPLRYLQQSITLLSTIIGKTGPTQSIYGPAKPHHSLSQIKNESSPSSKSGPLPCRFSTRPIHRLLQRVHPNGTEQLTAKHDVL